MLAFTDTTAAAKRQPFFTLGRVQLLVSATTLLLVVLIVAGLAVAAVQAMALAKEAQTLLDEFTKQAVLVQAQLESVLAVLAPKGITVPAGATLPTIELP